MMNYRREKAEPSLFFNIYVNVEENYCKNKKNTKVYEKTTDINSR